MEKVRCNIYLPESVVGDLKDMAEDLGFNMSNMIALACKTYIDQQKIIKMANFDEIGTKLNDLEKLIVENIKVD